MLLSAYRALLPKQTSLLNGLVSYWPLNEASGATRLDVVGTNHLTDSNTVGSAAGPTSRIALAADYPNNTTKKLSVASNASLQLGANTPWTVAGWWNWLGGTSNGEGLMAAKASSFTDDNTVEWGIQVYQGKAAAQISNGATNTAIGDNTVLTALGWQFIAAWYDSVAQTLNFQRGNGTIFSVAWTGGTQTAAAAVTLGANSRSGNFTMQAAGVGFWKRALTAQERAALWDSGRGILHPFNGAVA